MYDLFIIGGGVNGAGVARDAAGRGLKTGLCERDDLAMHTSSASTKLIHGGLRYLEQYAFRLVRESLMEREVLLRAAPHIIWPLRFVLPHHKGLRPAWLLRLGLFLYDHLGGRELLPPTKALQLNRSPYAGQLKPGFVRAFAYSDCWVEDARLVALNALDARERGADVFTRTECLSLERGEHAWRVTLKGPDGATRTVEARALINAAGPWADEVDMKADPRGNRGHVRLVKGGHIVTKRLFDTDHAYIFQNADGRILFTIPYERDFTLIGTTDFVVESQAEGAEITREEIDYLCENVGEYLARPVTPEDVVWTYAGVRALYDDASENASKVTRDYVLDLNVDGAPRLSVYGGKLTTYRKLAEHALDKLARVTVMPGAAWTAGAPLPGGDIADADFEGFLQGLKAKRPWVPDDLIRRLARAYGTRTDAILGDAATLDDLGAHFGAGLYEREVRHLIHQEFARTAEDVLWRRSKLGLHMTSDERAALAAWFASERGRRVVAHAYEREWEGTTP